jgi:hypothetical protein
MVSTKDCIQDFIEAWLQWDQEKNNEMAPYDKIVPHWNHRFRDAGYYRVESSRDSVTHSWNEMHSWCQEHVGPRHYAWAGSTFWFESDRAAVLFALRWS